MFASPHGAEHAGLAVPWDQAGALARLAELPDGLCGLLQSNLLRIVVRHIGVHSRRVLWILSICSKNEFMIQLTIVLQYERDLLALLRFSEELPVSMWMR
ncbi:hypothetical protein ACVIHI_008890 [Bradyrhizobium sp. USDA 4524]|nr:hypothetical protein [Bradyrhizobium sp. USDA 4538]MCP1907035.1 hypothetical protein [Bradyrhizobium sp. USDA 4537]MCP1985511.1 hypothetical protein [Bradyrhizobium sp. USDA 4539]